MGVISGDYGKCKFGGSILRLRGDGASRESSASIVSPKSLAMSDLCEGLKFLPCIIAELQQKVFSFFQ